MLLQCARSLAVDRAAGEVAGALQAAGTDVMLVKGAAVTRLLYDDGAPRAYSDCDLLVRRSDLDRAGSVLIELGFERRFAEERFLPADQLHAQSWHREADRASVDLHWTFIGCDAGPEAVFAALWDAARRARVGGTDIAVPSPAASVVLASLQLLVHGPSEGAKHRVDVERAIDRVDDETWLAAADLARRVGAEPAFGAGLRLAAGGMALAARLGLPDAPHARGIAQAPTDGWAVKQVDRVSRTPGLAAKARLLIRYVVPPRSYIEFVNHSVDLSRTRIAVIYLWRPFRLALRAPRVLWVWRNARRRGRAERRGRGAGRVAAARAAVWAFRAALVVRRRVAEGGLPPFGLPPVPPVPASAAGGVLLALRPRLFTCLVRASVRQAWLKAHGVRRDLIIGVTSPRDFSAHAWLDGDPPAAAAGYTELTRLPA